MVYFDGKENYHENEERKCFWMLKFTNDLTSEMYTVKFEIKMPDLLLCFESKLQQRGVGVLEYLYN